MHFPSVQRNNEHRCVPKRSPLRQVVCAHHTRPGQTSQTCCFFLFSFFSFTLFPVASNSCTKKGTTARWFCMSRDPLRIALRIGSRTHSTTRWKGHGRARARIDLECTLCRKMAGPAGERESCIPSMHRLPIDTARIMVATCGFTLKRVGLLLGGWLVWRRCSQHSALGLVREHNTRHTTRRDCDMHTHAHTKGMAIACLLARARVCVCVNALMMGWPANDDLLAADGVVCEEPTSRVSSFAGFASLLCRSPSASIFQAKKFNRTDRNTEKESESERAREHGMCTASKRNLVNEKPKHSAYVLLLFLPHA